MKYRLMSTTALVAASLLVSAGAVRAQGKPKLSLGGWVEGILGTADQDITAANGLGSRVAADVQWDSETHFNGDVQLDNGIRVRSKVEFETQSSLSSDLIDEAFIAVSGRFGEIRIGSEDNAAHLMVTPLQGSWATSVGQNLNFDVQDWIENPGNSIAVGGTNRLDLGDNDSEKITYFTPRFSGFQLGVSYMPSFNEGQDGRIERRADAFFEGYAIAANYMGKFDQVGVGLAAGYAAAKANTQRVSNADPTGYVLGGTLDFAGFRFAAGYHSERDLVDTAPAGATDNGADVVDLGIRYTMGRHNFSLGYAHAQAPGSNLVAGDDKLDQAMLSYRRDLGPGVQYRLNLMWADWAGEENDGTTDNNGFALTTSVYIAF